MQLDPNIGNKLEQTFPLHSQNVARIAEKALSIHAYPFAI